MFITVLATLVRASISEVPAETPVDPSQWRCRNQVEVWCSADGCAASEPENFTPMEVSAGRDGALSVCAYTGCWGGAATVTAVQGRALWTADSVRFSTNPDMVQAAVTLLINEKDGVGFVKVGGLATPLLCEHGGVIQVDAE